jgi:hypothetical protein
MLAKLIVVLVAVLTVHVGSAFRARRLPQIKKWSGSHISMIQDGNKAAWWKTAVASLGILAGTASGTPLVANAADTVQVN